MWAPWTSSWGNEGKQKLGATKPCNIPSASFRIAAQKHFTDLKFNMRRDISQHLSLLGRGHLMTAWPTRVPAVWGRPLKTQSTLSIVSAAWRYSSSKWVLGQYFLFLLVCARVRTHTQASECTCTRGETCGWCWNHPWCLLSYSLSWSLTYISRQWFFICCCFCYCWSSVV